MAVQLVWLGRETLEPELQLAGHRGVPHAVAAHPAAPYVATAGDDMLAIWTLPPLAPRLLAAVSLVATAVAIAPDSEDVAVGLADGSLALLDMRPVGAPPPPH
jgi:hypothetical protein